MNSNTARQSTDSSAVRSAVGSCILEVLGTETEPDAPLMAAGMDSLGVTELQRALCKQLSTEVEATLLFDHPTVSSITSFLVV